MYYVYFLPDYAMLSDMRRIERSPFYGKVAGRLGTQTSTDSVVMLVHSYRLKQGVDRTDVIKWNRSLLPSAQEALQVVEFTRRSIALYKEVLGEEHIVPTQLLVSEKVDNGKVKIKVYEVQPYISGWDGKNLPEDLRHDETLVERWRRLSSRVSLLYLVAYNVNRKVKQNGGVEFPVNLSLGTSRKVALLRNSTAIITEIPKTPNILVDRTDLHLHLCDFGAYTPWDERMAVAHKEILEHSVQAVKILEGTT